MKKGKIIVLLIFLYLLTGCVKYEYSMQINADKSMTITLINAFKTDAETNSFIESKEAYEERGYVVSPYSDDEYQGQKLTKKFDSIDEISSSNCGRVKLEQIMNADTAELVLFKSEKKNDVTTYHADFLFDIGVGNTNDDETDSADEMVFNYTVKLPPNATIIEHNADKTSDETVLSWKMQYGQEKIINYSFAIADKDVVVEEDEEIDEVISNDTISNNHSNANDAVKSKPSLISYLSSFLIIALAFGFLISLLYLKKRWTNTRRRNDKNKKDLLKHSSPPSNIEK